MEQITFTTVATAFGAATMFWALFARVGSGDGIGGESNLLGILITIPVAGVLVMTIIFLVPIILAALGVVLLVAVAGFVLYGLWKMLTSKASKPFFQAFFKAIGKLLNAICSPLWKLLKKGLSAVGKLLKAAREILGRLINTALKAVGKLLKTVLRFVRKILKSVFQRVVRLLKSALNFLSKVLRVLLEVFKSPVKTLRELLRVLGRIFKGIFKAVWSPARTLKAAFGMVARALRRLGNLLRAALRSVTKVLRAAMRVAVEATNNVLEFLRMALKDVPRVLGVVLKLMRTAWRAIGRLLSPLWRECRAIRRALTEILARIVSAIRKSSRALMRRFPILGRFRELLARILKRVPTGLLRLIRALLIAVLLLFTWIGRAVSRTIEKLTHLPVRIPGVARLLLQLRKFLRIPLLLALLRHRGEGKWKRGQRRKAERAGLGRVHGQNGVQGPVVASASARDRSDAERQTATGTATGARTVVRNKNGAHGWLYYAPPVTSCSRDEVCGHDPSLCTCISWYVSHFHDISTIRATPGQAS